MGVKMTGKISGLNCELVHAPSGATLHTVPPADNGGDGSRFSPTDLLAASLGACAVSTMALLSKREGLVFLGAHVTIEKEMSPPPRRVASVELHFVLPKATAVSDRQRLESFARECPVARSLHPDVAVPMTFEYV
jgi:putative redox protein